MINCYKTIYYWGICFFVKRASIFILLACQMSMKRSEDSGNMMVKMTSVCSVCYGYILRYLQTKQQIMPDYFNKPAFGVIAVNQNFFIPTYIQSKIHLPCYRHTLKFLWKKALHLFFYLEIWEFRICKVQLI